MFTVKSFTPVAAIDTSILTIFKSLIMNSAVSSAVSDLENNMYVWI